MVHQKDGGTGPHGLGIPNLSPCPVTERNVADVNDPRLSEVISSNFDVDTLSFILGIPFDRAIRGRPGAGGGPGGLRSALRTQSTYDIDTGRSIVPGMVCDLGDIEVLDDVDATHERVRDILRTIRSGGSTAAAIPQMVPIIIGGDHSLSAPVVEGLHGSPGTDPSAYTSGPSTPSSRPSNPPRLGVINIDAHLDIRDWSPGDISSGSPFRILMDRGVVDPSDYFVLGPQSFSNSRHYVEFARSRGVTIVSLAALRQEGMRDSALRIMAELSSRVDIIHLSMDLDCLSASSFPGVSAPTVDGFTPGELRDLSTSLIQGGQVVSLDMMELSPSHDPTDTSSRTAAWLLAHILHTLAFVRGQP